VRSLAIPNGAGHTNGMILAEFILPLLSRGNGRGRTMQRMSRFLSKDRIILLARRLRRSVVELHRRQPRFRWTLEGILYVSVTLSIGLAAFNTGTNLLYLICSMLLSFLVLSGIVSTNSLRGLDVSRSAPRHAVAGEPCRIEIHLNNRKRWSTSYSLRVVDSLVMKEPLGSVYFLSIRSHAVAHASYRTRFPSRGIYRLGEVKIISRFPFGLVERSWGKSLPHEILVYPRIVDIHPVLERAEADLGEVESGQKGHGISLLQLREYTGQESARDIHWKTSARAGRLMVKEHEKEEKRRVSIYLYNATPTPPSAELQERFELAVVLAASLVKYLIDREHQVQLTTATGRVPFGMGISHLHRCLRALARIELETREAGHPPTLPPPEAESANLYVHFDPERGDEVYEASARVLDVEKWREILRPSPGGLAEDSQEPPPRKHLDEDTPPPQDALAVSASSVSSTSSDTQARENKSGTSL